LPSRIRKKPEVDVIFGYTGREYDAETGLNYHRARYYDSDTGRWLSEDPIGVIDDANLYRYVGNYVTGATDPTGLYSKSFGGASPFLGTSAAAGLAASAAAGLGSPFAFAGAAAGIATASAATFAGTDFQAGAAPNPAKPLDTSPYFESNFTSPTGAALSSLWESTKSAFNTSVSAIEDTLAGGWAMLTNSRARGEFSRAWQSERIDPMANRLTAKAKYQGNNDPSTGQLWYSVVEDATVGRLAESIGGARLTGEAFEDGLWDGGQRTQHFFHGVSDTSFAAAGGISAGKGVVGVGQRVASSTATTAGARSLNNSGLRGAAAETATVYPPNRGFIGTPGRASAVPGAQLDRYGGPGGSFLSPAGTPVGARSLAPGAELRPLSTYEVIKPFEMDAGTVAPWFKQSGGGIQYDLGTTTVQDLINGGYLRPVK
jgi:RHS repeat-associated protein